jgi:two-component system, chemotaxis family, protein-glutamate methylesterase/glutaminase
MPVQSKVVVIGASAGGLDALKRLVKRLPADFPAAVLVVLHIGSHYSILPTILQGDSLLPVRYAEDGQPVMPGVILIAPPDRHLLLEDGMTRVTKGAKENFARPAIDPLFRTAAIFYRENVIGIVLSGLMDDGTIGLQAIKIYGGIAMVQAPEDADEPSMPRSALQHVQIDECLPAEALADRLTEIVRQAPEPASPVSDWHTIEMQAKLDLRQKTEIEELAQIAQPSAFSCPECSGSLWQLKNTNPLHFRCHTGHSFTAQGLAYAQDSAIEEAIWIAIRALHEKQMLMTRHAKAAEQANRRSAASEHLDTVATLERHADVLRKILMRKDKNERDDPRMTA